MKYIKFIALFIFLFPVCSFSQTCSPVDMSWSSTWDRHVEVFDTQEEAQAYCDSMSFPSDSCSDGASNEPCNSNPGYFFCWENDYANNDQYFAAYCLGLSGDCPDADEDGTPDACDDCPDDPAIQTLDEYRYYLDETCDGVYDGMTTGEYCGSCSETCDGGDQECQGSKESIAVTSMGIGCCSNFGSTTPPPCVLDENCERESDCECPDGSNACDECECTCPDGSDSCEECQKPDCECGEGILHCEECQGGGGGGGEPGDPEEPNLPGEPAEIPDEVQVGECIISLIEFKQWIVSDESFPFNFVYAIYGVLGPLYNISPSIPQFSVDLSPDSSGISLAFDIDFAAYDSYATFVRNIQAFGIVLAFVFYGIKRYSALSGVVRY
jgi:hypothetical protein